MTTTVVVGNINEHKETVRDNDSIIIQETWSIPTFFQVLSNSSIIEIHSPTYKELTPLSFSKYTFQFMIKFQRRDFTVFGQNNIEIHFFYMPSTNLFLESIRITASGDKLVPIMPSSTMIWPQTVVEAKKWRGFIGLSTKVVNQSIYSGFPNSSNTVELLGGCFHFEFVVSTGRVTEKNQIQLPATQLSNDFENLLNAGMFSDVVMKSAEDEEFRVHKAVLASRSAVLKAHFEHNTKETITNIVESPLESAVLLEVLSFIYTDKAPKVDEIPEKLLAAADYYQLSRLKSLCEEALHKKLTVDNAIETLQLADLHLAENLEKVTLEFIKKDFGKSKLITKTEGWAKLKSVDLLKKICE